MADYTITINNTVRAYGEADASVYGTAIYGTDKYGTDSDMELVVEKVLDSTATIASTLIMENAKVLDLSTATISSQLYSLYLIDRAGYYHVFKSDTTNAASQTAQTFGKITTGTSGFSRIAQPTTTWSRL
jgi:hypothetical protein